MHNSVLNPLCQTEKTAVAVSGGIDSLCAMRLLKASGRDVLALHGVFNDHSDPPAALAQICADLNVPFHVFDLRQEFHDLVIQPFLEDMANGLTPNPCVHCNKNIKFGILQDLALKLGARHFATGHYCRLGAFGNSFQQVLAPALDNVKDQGYFLGLVKAHRLQRTIFPLSGLQKSDVRSIISNAGLSAPIAKESQDICFLGNQSLQEFLARHGYKNTPGPVVLRTHDSRNLPVSELPQAGTHNGLHFYTPGQRKGLGIPWRAPLYVRAKNFGANILEVAPLDLMAMRGCVTGNFNFHIPRADWPDELFTRLRYKQPVRECTVESSNGKLFIRLNEPCFTSAPGQLAAVYDKAGNMLGSGIIEKIFYAV